MPPKRADTTGTADNAEISAFQAACSDGDLPNVQAALARGRLSAKTLDSGLSLATHEARLDIVTALFDAGIPMTPSAISSLPGKDGYQDPRMIRLYFARGLRPRQCVTDNGVPLLCYLDAPCARELLERGVNPNRRGSQNKPSRARTPLLRVPIARAVRLAHEDDGALFDLLVEYGATFDASLFFTAIVWSKSNPEYKTRFLLAKGLDPNTTCPNWGTPLHAAIRFAMEEVVQILLDAGADPTARTGSRQFRDLSPVELADRSIRCRKEQRDKYERIFKVLKDAEARHATSRVGVPTDKSRPESLSMEQAHTKDTHEYIAESKAKKQRITKIPTRQLVADSISNRTRSKTKSIC